MSTILLKPANLTTSVSRNEIRKAVEQAFRTLHLYQTNGTLSHAAKKAARKKAARKK